VTDLSGFLRISTRSVDNIVDKRPPARRKARIQAGFYKMLIPKAKIFFNKINYLKLALALSQTVHSANSYKTVKQGITRVVFDKARLPA
jgi:predicted PP-loop superfamily ATPase